MSSYLVLVTFSWIFSASFLAKWHPPHTRQPELYTIHQMCPNHGFIQLQHNLPTFTLNAPIDKAYLLLSPYPLALALSGSYGQNRMWEVKFWISWRWARIIYWKSFLDITERHRKLFGNQLIRAHWWTVFGGSYENLFPVLKDLGSKSKRQRDLVQPEGIVEYMMRWIQGLTFSDSRLGKWVISIVSVILIRDNCNSKWHCLYNFEQRTAHKRCCWGRTELHHLKAKSMTFDNVTRKEACR